MVIIITVICRIRPSKIFIIRWRCSSAMPTRSYTTTKIYQRHLRNFSILKEWYRADETSENLQLISILNLLFVNCWKDSKLDKTSIEISRKSSRKIRARYLSHKKVIINLSKFLAIERINGKEEWSQVHQKLCLGLPLRGLSKIWEKKNKCKLRKFRLRKTSLTLELQLPILWRRGICVPIALLRRLLLIFTCAYRRTISFMTVSKCKWVVTCALSMNLTSKRFSTRSNLTRVIRRIHLISRMFCTI